MRKFLHWIAHRLGTNEGHVMSFSIGGHTMVGFRCNACGRISHAHCVDAMIDREIAARASTGEESK